MVIIDEKLNISVNRGNVLPLSINTKDKNGNNYVFQEGEVVRFKIFKKKDYNSIEVQKDVEVVEPTEFVDVVVTSEEMKIGEIINKPVEYWYEVELNPDTEYTQTIIGHTKKDGPKILWLLPEGADK